MITQRSEVQFAIFDAVNHTVLIRNPPRPPAREVVLERFRFADTLIRRAFNIFNHSVDAFEYLFILLEPVQIIFPGRLMKTYFTQEATL